MCNNVVHISPTLNNLLALCLSVFWCRYLRPPLGRGQVPIPHGPTTASSTRGGFNHRDEKKDEEDNVSRELKRWRDGVAKCTSAAQVHSHFEDR